MGKANLKISSQLKSIKCEINLSQSHGDSICPLKALYVDIFFVFFLDTEKSLNRLRGLHWLFWHYLRAVHARDPHLLGHEDKPVPRMHG